MALLFSKQYETRVQMVKHFIISAGSSWFGVLKYFNLAIHPSACEEEEEAEKLKRLDELKQGRPDFEGRFERNGGSF